jgi:hypothetical protein
VSAWIEDKRVSQQPEHVRAAISPLIERASSQPAVLKAAGDYSVLYKSRMAADYDRLAVPNLALAKEQCRNAVNRGGDSVSRPGDLRRRRRLVPRRMAQPLDGPAPTVLGWDLNRVPSHAYAHSHRHDLQQIG